MNSAKSDLEICADFMRMHENRGRWTLEVAIVEWVGGAHSPELRWVVVEQFAGPQTDTELAAAQQRLLANPRFFRLCKLCLERNNVGHMHDDKICQGCAEREHGIIY